MQTIMRQLILAIRQLVNGTLVMVDTHSAAGELRNPTGRPDLCGMDTEAHQAVWSNVVTFFEWKLKDVQAAELVGLLRKRSCGASSTAALVHSLPTLCAAVGPGHPAG